MSGYEHQAVDHNASIRAERPDRNGFTDQVTVTITHGEDEPTSITMWAEDFETMAGEVRTPAPTPRPHAERAPEYTREDLLAICERAFVPHAFWSDRDTAAAQRQLGECYALLKAGCDFIVRCGGDHMVTDEQTIWVELTFRGFGHFDWGGHWDTETFYLPTTDRLDHCNGQDWY